MADIANRLRELDLETCESFQIWVQRGGVNKCHEYIPVSCPPDSGSISFESRVRENAGMTKIIWFGDQMAAMVLAR